MDWAALRAEFPVTKRWAFFDHAAVAPLSGRAQRAMTEWAAHMAENGDAELSQWEHRVEEVRTLFGQLLNTDPLNVAFTKNTSEGIAFVAEGFPWQPGDNIVTAAEEYPSNLYPWMNLAGRGVEVRQVASRSNRIEVDDIRAALDSHTKIVSLSSVEFASGFRNDLDAIGSLCRERGIFFFVDAIQSLGMLPLDVGKTPVDFLAADGHKWLLGPEGAGIFYIRRELVDQLHTNGVGWNSVIGCHSFDKIDFRLKPHAGRWESGTLNVAGIMALGASLGLLLEIGIDALSERLVTLTDHFCAAAERAGINVFSSRRPGDKSGIVSLATRGDPRALVRKCKNEGIIVNQRAGRVRVSPHCYNSLEELDRLIEVLR
jgi:cysteine desulfurase/selenocysteine lyase